MIRCSSPAAWVNTNGNRGRIFWSEHSNARLVSESLAFLTPEKNLCVESAYNEHCWRHDPGSRFLHLPPAVKLSGNWTSLVSRWVPNRGGTIYGHWLHDALPRLALLKEFPADTQIIVPPNLGAHLQGKPAVARRMGTLPPDARTPSGDRTLFFSREGVHP